MDSDGMQKGKGAAAMPDLAQLRYVGDHQPGFRRLRCGKGFRYCGMRGETIREPVHLARIRALAIPPAWTDVWICPHPEGHIQATGRDAKGRKQYRYHSHWSAVRNLTKFGRMADFAQALPGLREQVQRDLALPGLPRRKVLAAMVRLLEATLIRVGNDEYVRANGSFGLTTLRDRHVMVAGSAIHFRFKGKSGVLREVALYDRRLARIVKNCQDLPGQELFQYIDESGDRRTVDSADINGYLQETVQGDFTAKDFRTWAGTVEAARTLAAMGPAESATQGKGKIAQAVKQVARQLANTPAVCRNYYIHPAVIEAYLTGTLSEAFAAEPDGDGMRAGGLQLHERAVLRLLQQWQPEPVAAVSAVHEHQAADGRARLGREARADDVGNRVARSSARSAAAP